MNAFSFLRGEMLIWLVFSGILLSAIGLFRVLWFLPPLRRLGAALSETLAALGPAGEPWTLDRSTTVRQVVATHPELRQAWQETEQRIIAVPVSGRLRVLMLGSPRDLGRRTGCWPGGSMSNWPRRCPICWSASACSSPSCS